MKMREREEFERVGCDLERELEEREKRQRSS